VVGGVVSFQSSNGEGTAAKKKGVKKVTGGEQGKGGVVAQLHAIKKKPNVTY